MESRRLSTIQVALIAFALLHLTLAALMTFTPSAFFSDIGPFGLRNDHYLRDLATFEAAFAVALAIAAARPRWRVPVLACVSVQFVLHTVNHLYDIGAATPHWLGPLDFAGLAAGSAALLFLLHAAMRSPAGT